MPKYVVMFLILASLLSCQTETNKNSIVVQYPPTKKEDTIDTYFNIPVPDPYRWLEDDMSDETKVWVKAQNTTTFDYLDRIPFRNDLKKRLKQVWNYEKLGLPFKEGDYTYFYKNDGLQNQYAVYRKKEDVEAEIFLDPNTFSEDGTTSLMALEFTKDGSKVVYLISEGGSDWRKAIVLDTNTKEVIGDTLINIKHSSISWRGNEGFFYSSYDKPEGSELSAVNNNHKLYYHKLGTPQSEDQVVFGTKQGEEHMYIGGYVSEDENYLFISASNSTSGNKLFLKDLTKPNLPLVTILNHYESDTYVVSSKGSKLWLVTNLDAPNKKVVIADATMPSPVNWQDFVAETENVLNITTGGGYFFAEYMVDAISKVLQYDYEGNLVREVKLPDAGSINGFGGKKDEKVFFFYFTNYSTPWSSYKFDVETGQYQPYWTPDIDFEPNDYESSQIFYTSKDGTKVPMIITHKKGLERNGKNPTILYGYGGFNVSLTPFFSTANAVWMEQGGVYAVPNIRGGGEYGKKWHNAGTKTQKQNVFDDFIAAAEYLIENEYTSSDYLAINGASNGGLLVGVTMTQRPDLMKVAIPEVGVLDMLRYHRFTIGNLWAYDYGTSEESKEMFTYLKAYSPVHNVKSDVGYPATLITTGDHDNTVVPAHSFKFAAALQEKQSGSNPTLIRVETNTGHGAGKPMDKIIEQYTDILSFTLFNMGYNKLPNQAVAKNFKD